MIDVFRVDEPGMFTTVQDLGRPNAIASGVTPGGAMDRFAHSAANLLVGNEAGAATLECTLVGPRLVALRPALVAVTGGELEFRINGRHAPTWTALFVGEGAHLTFGTRRSGARAYVAISGGVAGERWLGSLSTYTLISKGGMAGRALTAGDVVRAAAIGSSPAVSGRTLPPQVRPDYGSHVLHAIPVPHVQRLTPSDRETFFTATFRVSLDANRMGYRLEGPPLSSAGEEVLS
ncbi:MAG TPA: biotin-dependent carboxyltransferase family protein, partial [Candidatus Sulfotelmatobacter sp.]|nr:biotin-dependent carboxyltransferase family protein [Candidatus Sulfotelmatobacter sp.]